MKHFVSVDNLDETKVLELIKRAQYFKNGGQINLTRAVYCVNMFLKIRRGRIRVLRWLSVN